MTATTHNGDMDRGAPGGASNGIGKYAASFGISLGLTSLFSAVLVIVKETNEDTVLAWMKAATGHHWITHGLLDLALFLALGFLLAGFGERWRHRPGLVTAWVAGGVVVGSLIIAGFYV